jgi:hypothetical protein
MKTITETEAKVQVTKKTVTTCDICKEKCGLSCVEIEFRDLEVDYPESQRGIDYEYDICNECFEDKVMVMLGLLGAEPSKKEFDY